MTKYIRDRDGTNRPRIGGWETRGLAYFNKKYISSFGDDCVLEGLTNLFESLRSFFNEILAERNIKSLFKKVNLPFRDSTSKHNKPWSEDECRKLLVERVINHKHFDRIDITGRSS